MVIKLGVPFLFILCHQHCVACLIQAMPMPCLAMLGAGLKARGTAVGGKRVPLHKHTIAYFTILYCTILKLRVEAYHILRTIVYRFKMRFQRGGSQSLSSEFVCGYTLNPNLKTLNPKLRTLDPKLKTLNSKPIVV